MPFFFLLNKMLVQLLYNMLLSCCHSGNKMFPGAAREAPSPRFPMHVATEALLIRDEERNDEDDKDSNKAGGICRKETIIVSLLLANLCPELAQKITNQFAKEILNLVEHHKLNIWLFKSNLT